MEVTDHADHTSGTFALIPDGFWSAVPPTGRLPSPKLGEAVSQGRTGTACFKDKPTDITEAGRQCPASALYIQLLLEHFSASKASTSTSARRASVGYHVDDMNIRPVEQLLGDGGHQLARLRHLIVPLHKTALDFASRCSQCRISGTKR